MELQDRVKELDGRGLGLAAISYDAPEVLAAFARQHGIAFPLLSDAGSATITRYGILNPVPELALGAKRDDPAVQALARTYVSGGTPGARMIGVALPGTFMLDREGRVTSRFFDDFYVNRTTASSVMLRVGAGAAPVSATRVSSSQIELTTWASDAAVAPGNRITLALEARPRPGMHVYAPGATGYRVIRLALDGQPFVRAMPMSYPQSEIYFFVPLNERVPVYSKPFTLLQEVLIEGTAPAQAALRERDALTLTATLEYQACDDKICYAPVSLPLSWTVALRRIVTGRPQP